MVLLESLVNTFQQTMIAYQIHVVKHKVTLFKTRLFSCISKIPFTDAIFIKNFSLCICVLGLRMHYMCPCCPMRQKKSVRGPGTGTKDGSKMSCGFWELNLGLF